MLCTHIPPEVPELCYDTVARRFERGSTALLEAIRATRPRYSLFGHVHQPLARRMRIGATDYDQFAALPGNVEELAQVAPCGLPRGLIDRSESHYRLSSDTTAVSL